MPPKNFRKLGRTHEIRGPKLAGRRKPEGIANGPITLILPGCRSRRCDVGTSYIRVSRAVRVGLVDIHVDRVLLPLPPRIGSLIIILVIRYQLERQTIIEEGLIKRDVECFPGLPFALVWTVQELLVKIKDARIG